LIKEGGLTVCGCYQRGQNINFKDVGDVSKSLHNALSHFVQKKNNAYKK